MSSFELLLMLLAASAALQVLAWRWRVPHPVVLVIGGASLALTHRLPALRLDPDVVFVAFIPPLLYWAAFTTSLRDFKLAFGPIARLGILLVLVTIGAVASVAHVLAPALTWPAAFALAAIVAPPDAIAATAVMRTLGAPSRLVNILEGEGLVNDATALVALRVAVAAAVTGTFSPTRAAISVLLTAGGGIAIGLAVGWTITWLRRKIIGLSVVENTVSLLTPFAAYIPADALGASGVLATVAAGLYLGRQGPHIVGAATRVQAEAMWSMITFLLESLIFILTGMELPRALQALHDYRLGTLLWYGLAVSAVVILVRLLWIFPSAYVPWLLRWRRGSRRRGQKLPTWQSVAFVGWAGMRGGDSLVFALALPFTTAAGRPFPGRDLIIFVTFAVIFSTLVLQGLSLRPLLRRLGLDQSGQLGTEEAHARRIVADAALRRLDEISTRDDARPEVFERLRRESLRKSRRWSARARARHGAADEASRADGKSEADIAMYRKLRTDMIDTERRTLVHLRDRGIIGDDVMRRVQRDLDLETMLLDGADARAAETPYELQG